MDDVNRLLFFVGSIYSQDMRSYAVVSQKAAGFRVPTELGPKKQPQLTIPQPLYTDYIGVGICLYTDAPLVGISLYRPIGRSKWSWYRVIATDHQTPTGDIPTDIEKMTDCLLHICTDQQFDHTNYYTEQQPNANHSYETENEKESQISMALQLKNCIS